MTSSTDDPLVTTDWLAAHIDDPKVKVIDASFKLPGVLPLPVDDYLAAHIPGAVFFDVDAIKAAQSDDVVIVDIRDPREIERDGKIPNAFSCTRGMLEFWIDPASPYAKPIFQQDKKFIFHCAGGMRSALAAKTAQDMGLKPVAHMAGGFAAWRDAGGPTEKWEPKKKG